MKQIKLILMCLGLITTLIACKKDRPEFSSEVDQDSIYVNYVVLYDEDTDITTVGAGFKGGELPFPILELDRRAFVSFDDDILPSNGPQDNSIFATYQKEYGGHISGTFVYEDLNNNVFVNPVPISKSMTFSEETEILSRTEEYTFQWEGLPFEEDEQLSLSYRTLEGNATTPVEGDRTANNELTLYPGRLSKMPLGPTEFIIERQQVIENVEGTSVGGEIKVIYRSAPKKVIIIP